MHILGVFWCCDSRKGERVLAGSITVVVVVFVWGSSGVRKPVSWVQLRADTPRTSVLLIICDYEDSRGHHNGDNHILVWV